MALAEFQSADSIWFATLSDEQRRELHDGVNDLILPRPDLLVVGGGIIGAAIAWFAAEAGLKVQLIESGELARGASGANAGGIWPNDQGPAHSSDFQQLAFLSRDWWARLAVRPNFDFDWRVNGFLNVNLERMPVPPPQHAAALQEQGYTVQAVDGEQIAALEPHLQPGLAGGVFCPADAHLHPVKAVLSFVKAARQKGAHAATGVRALAATVRGDRVVAVETSAGVIEPAAIVNATGFSAAWLAPLPLAPIPLRAVSGQLIATDPQPQVLNSSIGGKFIALQLRSGEIVAGGNVLEGENLKPDSAQSEQFADAARELIPALRDVPFTRSWCGLRPSTPDGLPVIDLVPGLSNLWLAGGHFRNGVLLAPATGKLTADWIRTGRKPGELDPFRFDRW